MKRGFLSGTYWMLLFLLVACQQGDSLEAPPEIIYGQDVCDECGMIINEQRYAASYVTSAGEVRRFDDIGGMLVQDHKVNEEVHIYWVHDFNTEEWVDASQANFVISRELVTPMGWGVVAFADPDSAEVFAAEHGGEIGSLEDLQEAMRAGSLDPGSFGDMHDGQDHEMSDDQGN
jgi:copper chaperone NosL